MNIIILHGWMQNKDDLEVFSKQLKTLPHIKKVVAFDLPGFGKEKLISAEWSIPEYASWVIDKIKKEKLTNVVLFGHSFGGRVAAFIASQNPSWLTALILSGTPAIYRPTLKMKLKLKAFKTLKTFVPAKTKQSFYSDELRQAEERGMGNVFRNVVRFDQTDLIKNISVPTLLVWGEADESVSTTIAREINQLVKSSQLVIISKGTHNSFVSHPYLFLGHVKKFIESL